MITYCNVKYLIKQAYDLEDVATGLMILPLHIILDIVFLLFQPMFYAAYKKWEKENE